MKFRAVLQSMPQMFDLSLPKAVRPAMLQHLCCFAQAGDVTLLRLVSPVVVHQMIRMCEVWLGLAVLESPVPHGKARRAESPCAGSSASEARASRASLSRSSMAEPSARLWARASCRMTGKAKRRTQWTLHS